MLRRFRLTKNDSMTDSLLWGIDLGFARIEEIEDWVRLRNINPSTQVVITPKYDGLSLCVNELTDEAWTRGDGTYGQKSDEHYKLIGNKLDLQPEENAHFNQ